MGTALESARRLSALLPFCSACHFNMVIPADPAAIGAVADGVAEALRNKPGVVGHEFEIELALQEALANAIRHGCQGDPTKFIQCVVTYEDAGDVLIVVRDPGPGFDLAGVPNPLEGTNVLQGSGLRDLPDEPADGRGPLCRRRSGASCAQAAQRRMTTA